MNRTLSWERNILWLLTSALAAISLLIMGEEASAEQSLVATLDDIKPGIVAVGTYMPKRSPRAQFRGTGFAIGNGRLVVTNAHVLPESLQVERRERIAVFIKKNGRDSLYYAKEVAVDTSHDVAVLKLDKGSLTPLKLSGKDVREGELYAFTGYPIGMVLGLYPVTHRGIISAISPVAIPMINSSQLNAKVMKRLRAPYNVYQLDATAYPGNSGSPLYHLQTGEVIGIINKVFVKESKENVLSKPSGISYAIPIVHLRNLLKDKGLLQ
ncbi:serine protease [Methylomarinum sp. Ch1-1]|uniref:Serine protease n=1 Tax=Methylomarinum roseum TaxID=3067653 RepID=A0AAU7NQC7_9GAMM|nr:serine protease [Methylomarinum sp. Ch1-1]MDP4521180.1 serine protease [Methylomarinum sp. Ch1-1]